MGPKKSKMTQKLSQNQMSELKETKLSRAELSQARNCLEVLSLHFFELSAYHLKVTLSAFGLASEILIGLAN